MAKNDRFEKVYSQGTMNVMEIWVDRETGLFQRLLIDDLWRNALCLEELLDS